MYSLPNIIPWEEPLSMLWYIRVINHPGSPGLWYSQGWRTSGAKSGELQANWGSWSPQWPETNHESTSDISKLSDSLQHNWPVIVFQNVKVMKNKGRQRNCLKLIETRDMRMKKTWVLEQNLKVGGSEGRDKGEYCYWTIGKTWI